jgi:hypothetical protein
LVGVLRFRLCVYALQNFLVTTFDAACYTLSLSVLESIYQDLVLLPVNDIKPRKAVIKI